MDKHENSISLDLKTLIFFTFSQIILATIIIDGYLHGKSYHLILLYLFLFALHTNKIAIIKKQPEKLVIYNLHQIVAEFALLIILAVGVAVGTVKPLLIIAPILLGLHIIFLSYTIFKTFKQTRKDNNHENKY
ncbi:hypothetical protein AB1I63_06410 [Streptococcus pneumoniae]